MLARPRILILGGGYAGLLTAARLSRSKRPLDITLVNGRDHFEQRIRFHESLAGGQPRTLALAPALQRRGIRLRTGWVEQLTPTVREVTLRHEHGREQLGYDYLILAPGSQVAAPVPGVAAHAWRLLSGEQTRRLTPELTRLAERHAHLAVVGGGLTALETATELKERHPALNVSLVTHATLDAGWSRAARRHLRQTLARLDIRVLENRRVARVAPGELIGADGERIAADRCIWAAGFRPSPLGRDAGLPTDDQGRVLTDDCLNVIGDERIFIAGDAAHARAGQADHLRMGCVTAMPQGARAGDNLRRRLNGEPMQPLSVGYFFRCVSLGRKEGLIQYTDNEDRPLERIHRGRLAAWIKEGICRMTYLAVKWELLSGRPLYRWPAGPGARGPNTTSQNEAPLRVSDQ